jgi:hypothetical protein
MVACPGCGVRLPGRSDDYSPRPGASAACWQLYGEIAANEAQHIAKLGRFHQLMVDAYAAQHPVPDGSGIGLAFGLVGLHLALDEGWRGDQVRAAHQALAGVAGKWPRFEPPASRGSMTVFDVAMADSPEAHADLLQRWAADVWAAWYPARNDIIHFLEGGLAAADRARLRSS